MMEEGFSGFMLWSLDLDDFSGTFCGSGNYPLLRAMNNVLNGAAPIRPTPSQPKPPYVFNTLHKQEDE